MTTYRAQGNAGFGLLHKDGSPQPLITESGFCNAGQDGDSRDPLITNISRGDIVRAKHGVFIAMVETN